MSTSALVWYIASMICLAASTTAFHVTGGHMIAFALLISGAITGVTACVKAARA